MDDARDVAVRSLIWEDGPKGKPQATISLRYDRVVRAPMRDGREGHLTVRFPQPAAKSALSTESVIGENKGTFFGPLSKALNTLKEQG